MRTFFKVGMFFLMISIGISGVSALEIRFGDPVLKCGAVECTGSGISSIRAGVTNLLMQIGESLQDDLSGLDTPKFYQGFASASTYSSHGATQRNFYKSDVLTVVVGSMIGVHLPDRLFQLRDLDQAETFLVDIVDNNDLNGGLSWGIANVSVGLNAGALFAGDNEELDRFLRPLVFGVKGGYMKIGPIADTFSQEFWNVGIFGSYQLVRPISLVVVNWHGLTVGTGFSYQHSATSFVFPFESGEAAENIGELTYKGKGSIALITDTFTIPLEIVTGISLDAIFSLNITIGLGVDINFGQSNSELKLGGSVISNFVTNAVTDLGANANADVSVEADDLITLTTTAQAPSPLKPKLVGGIGFGVGPVYVDIPVSFYFTDGIGLSAGVNVGVSF